MKLTLKILIISLSMALLAGCGKFEFFPDTESNPPATTAPVANAGSAQSVIVGDIIVLDGSGSSDADGDTLTYGWTLTPPDGSVAELSSTTAVDPTFTADVVGAYLLSLTVNDGKVSSAAATVTITAFDTPPTANAGPDQSGVIAGTTVQLDGSGSSGAIQSYNWSRKTASCGILSSATIVNPTITGSSAGTCVVELQVFNKFGSTTDTVSILVDTGSVTVTW